MYPVLIAILATVIGIGFWIDNEITHPIMQFWWLALPLACLVSYRTLPEYGVTWIGRTSVAIISALLIILCLVALDDLMVIYLVGVICLVTCCTSDYMVGESSDRGNASVVAVVIAVLLTLLVLPVSVNRILVKLPNLSAGTTLTLSESRDQLPKLDARFYNSINDHLEIETYLGSQYYLGQDYQPPLLRIDTTIKKVVIRLLSISYQHRLAYVDLPLFEIEDEDFSRVEIAENSGPARLGKDRIYLLVDKMVPGESVWLQLPGIEGLKISLLDRALVVIFRWLFWGMLVLAILVWAPRRNLQK